MTKSALPSFGRVWQGHEAAESFRDGTLRSTQDEKECKVRIAFRNASKVPLLLCWVSHRGTLHHFYELPPNGVSECPVHLDDHVERSVSGHAFCLAHVPEDEIGLVRRTKKLPDASMIIAGYRPYALDVCYEDDISKTKDDDSDSGEELEEKEEEFGDDNVEGLDPDAESEAEYEESDDEEDDEDLEMQLVTIKASKKSEYFGSDLLCCGPFGGAFLRGFRKRQKKQTFFDVTGDNEGHIAPEDWQLEVRMMEVDKDPYDTTDKVYEEKTLGGWPVRVEKNWHDGHPELEEMLARDLEAAAKNLPEHAREYLMKKCPVWVNKSIMYGPKVCPVKGAACCYHPDRRWLAKNGLCPSKAKCVEINDGACYGKDNDLWGVGGVMTHEMSHAYHHRMLVDGYANKQIKKCFDLAMKEGLYDSVRVHGTQGPTAKAYACTNCMEYFAELSAAFLGGTDENEEYNKWFPFNRAQIKEHDPRAYKMLSRVWKVNCD